MKEEIVSGIQSAIEHGSSLEEAIQSFTNAGYNPAEVKEAAREVSEGVTNLTQQPSQPSGQVTKINAKPLKQIQSGSTQIKQSVQGQQVSQNPQQAPKNLQLPSIKPNKSHKALIITIIVILVIIILILGAWYSNLSFLTKFLGPFPIK